MTDDLVKRQKEDALYAKDAWAKLAVEAGFRPYDTEASARSAFRHCADRIEALTAEVDRLKQEVHQFRRVNDGLQDAMLAAEAEVDRSRAARVEIYWLRGVLFRAKAYLEDDMEILAFNVLRAALKGQQP